MNTSTLSEQEIISLITTKLDLREDYTLKKKRGTSEEITLKDFILLAVFKVPSNSTPYKTASRNLSTIRPDLKSSKGSWGLNLTKLVGCRKCSKCCKVKYLESYYTGRPECKECSKTYKAANSSRLKVYHAEYQLANRERRRVYEREYSKLHKGKTSSKAARRRACKLNATTLWTEAESIREFYENRPEGHHVDHIVPLRHELVCGLHVIDNLQYLTAEENLKKSNRFEVC